MSRLNELIKKLCPNGVEYKKIKDCCNIETGKLNANAAVQDGKYMFFTTAKEISRTDTYRWDEEALLIAGNANVGDVKHYIGKFNAYQRTYVLTKFIKSINVKFLYYSLSNNLKTYLDSHKHQAAMTYIVLSTLENFEIPIPPLDVQCEIVHILDDFTMFSSELLEELSSELKARKEQYDYYKNKLLSFKNNTEFIELKKIFNTKNGYTPSKSKKEYWENGNIPWFRMEDIRVNGRILSNSIQHVNKIGVKGELFPKNSIIISTSATIGEHALITEEFLCNQRFTTLMLKEEYKDKYDIKFLFYYCYLLDEWCLNNLNKGNFASVDMKLFNNFKFPLIDINKQREIVNILERFDKLCSDILEYLPVEIEARKKQYEYYRNKLLTFKELENEVN